MSMAVVAAHLLISVTAFVSNAVAACPAFMSNTVLSAARCHISGSSVTLNLVPTKRVVASDGATPAPKGMVAEPSIHGL